MYLRNHLGSTSDFTYVRRNVKIEEIILRRHRHRLIYDEQSNRNDKGSDNFFLRERGKVYERLGELGKEYTGKCSL